MRACLHEQKASAAIAQMARLSGLAGMAESVHSWVHGEQECGMCSRCMRQTCTLLWCGRFSDVHAVYACLGPLTAAAHRLVFRCRPVCACCIVSLQARILPAQSCGIKSSVCASPGCTACLHGSPTAASQAPASHFLLACADCAGCVRVLIVITVSLC